MRAVYQRCITAFAIGVPLLLCVAFLDKFYFSIIIGLISAVAFLEWLYISGYRMRRILCFSAAVMIGLGVIAIHGTQQWAHLLLIGMIAWWLYVGVFVVLACITHQPLRVSTGSTAGAGVVLSGGVAICLLQEAGGWRLFELFVLIWSADSISFFAGRRWGKHKLAPSLSPGKTIQGAIGGAVSVLIAGMLIYYIHESLTESRVLWKWLLLLLVVWLVSVIGDLYESALKRRGGVKDSGSILPGHGGVLDRIDSTLAAGPFFHLGLEWLN